MGKSGDILVVVICIFSDDIYEKSTLGGINLKKGRFYYF